MATTTRQTAVFGLEDWKRFYQNYSQADFQSYDFETIRKTFVDYLRLYYPETFNDYTESSEFIALLDVMAFMGQALAFRNDLNARENFIDTAERRDSVVKLASLVDYTPKRNIPSQGYLKVVSVSTTENVYDYQGNNLAGVTINWNDLTNESWYDQFTSIINATLVNSQRVGKPGGTATILNVLTEEYAVNMQVGFLPVIPFSTAVDGITMPFEAVSASIQNQDAIVEPAPRPNSVFNILYRNDRQGYGSTNTGWFLYFKQGILLNQDFNFPEKINNNNQNIDIEGVNDQDVWLYQLDEVCNITRLWTPKESIYTASQLGSSERSLRTIYSITSRANDQIQFNFGDNTFAEAPVGTFRTYVRQSNGLTYTINPEEMQSVVLQLSYVDRNNKIQTITYTLNLQQNVTNSQARESITEIKQRAPSRFYTQNRMVNGEDYNQFPYSQYNSIIKSKSIVRSVIGAARNLDFLDITGKYSSTNVFADDGVLYEQVQTPDFAFDFLDISDINSVIINDVQPITRTKELLQFYYENFPRPQLNSVANPYGQSELPVPAVPYLFWHQSSVTTNTCTGWFANIPAAGGQQYPQAIGAGASGNLQYIQQSSLVKFEASLGSCFDANNRLQTRLPTQQGDHTIIWATVTRIIRDGSNQGRGDNSDGTGPVSLNNFVPQGAIPTEVIPVFVNTFSTDLINLMVQNVLIYRNFGLGYDNLAGEWYFISNTNLDVDAAFDISTAQNLSNTNSDAAWMFQFITDGVNYTVTYRNLEYIFGSVSQCRFFFDDAGRIFDVKKGSIVNDYISVLRSNPDANAVPPYSASLLQDVILDIIGQTVESDGYVNDFGVEVSFGDYDQDTVADDPDVFNVIVAPNVDPDSKYVFLQRTVDFDDLERYLLIPEYVMNKVYATKEAIEAELAAYPAGQLFFAYQDKTFWELRVDPLGGRTVTARDDFQYRIGRAGLYFQYRHNSPNTRRIDPGTSNIIDIYVVTNSYYNEYRNWITDSTNTVSKPAVPTMSQLSQTYQGLNEYKMLSDNIVLNSVMFKPLFGAKADPELRALFKVVKNSNTTASDQEVKSAVVASLNTYFDIDNWNFGDTFYASELSAYLHDTLSTLISSVVLVPQDPNKAFGNLYEIRSSPTEIFVNAATVNDVEIIAALTPSELRIQTTVSY